MTLELNKPYLVKRVASNGGVLHYLPMDGFCDDIALDAPVLAKRVASSAGVLHYLIGNQQLAADGKLTLNKPYLAKRVASNAGVLHYLVGGKVCEEPPEECGPCSGCESDTIYPGTLNVTVTISSFETPFTFTVASAGGNQPLGPCGTVEDVADGRLQDPGDSVIDKSWTGSTSTSGTAGTFAFNDCAFPGGSFSSTELRSCTLTIQRIRYVDAELCIKTRYGITATAIERLNSTGYQSQVTMYATVNGAPEPTVIACDPFEIEASGSDLPCVDDQVSGDSGYSDTTEGVGASWTISAVE